ncbi:hypothetical protein SVAN01_12014, partial [Stagonosporopsis vannaccii]
RPASADVQTSAATASAGGLCGRSSGWALAVVRCSCLAARGRAWAGQSSWSNCMRRRLLSPRRAWPPQEPAHVLRPLSTCRPQSFTLVPAAVLRPRILLKPQPQPRPQAPSCLPVRRLWALPCSRRQHPPAAPSPPRPYRPSRPRRARPACSAASRSCATTPTACICTRLTPPTAHVRPLPGPAHAPPPTPTPTPTPRPCRPRLLLRPRRPRAPLPAPRPPRDARRRRSTALPC